ncbi:MAG: adventurous gliding motility protein T [Bdellovibrionaceae bacterium]|nr:adventurous gliding motility protein T [Pseudobdellovibrionaceae bacterium]
MMKKIISISVLFGFLTGCGSLDKSTGSGDDSGYSPTTPSGTGSSNSSFDMGGVENTTGQASSGFAQSANAKPAIPASQAIPPTSQGALVDAIKSQNDEQIFRVSGQLLVQNPNDVRALNAMAMYYFKKGKVDAAKYLLNKALVANPNAGEVYSNMGLIYLANNERRDAIKSFHRALDINANDGVSAANAGSIYVAERDYVKAASALSVAYNHGVRDAKTLNNYAISLTAVQRYDEAASVFQVAMKEQNNNREILLNYAILLIDHLNKFKEGVDVLSRLKFVGPPSESRNRIIALENKAKAGLK